MAKRARGKRNREISRLKGTRTGQESRGKERKVSRIRRGVMADEGTSG